MAKKPKKPDNSVVKSNGDPSSGSSNIFKTLFGDLPEKQRSDSIFTDQNPFRRKPSDRSQAPHQQQQNPKQQVGLGFGSADEVGNTANGEHDNPDFDELKKRKRDKGKKPILDSGSIREASETPFKIKKSKKREPTGSNVDLGVDSNESLKPAKDKKHNLVPAFKEPSERGIRKDINLGMKLEALPKQEEEKYQKMGMEAKGRDKKTKKKRKRDELEAEYEVRHSGVVETNDESGEGALEMKAVGKKRKKADDPVDMVVSKEGFDDEAKLLRTVFVGNLSLQLKKKALLKEFSQFGEVESVRIRSVPLLDTNKPRKGAIILKKINSAVDSVHAYIVFKTEQSAQASLAHNMAVVGGNHIRVDRACPPRKKLKGENAPLYDNKRTVFVGNLPFDVKDEEIFQLFSGIKDLESSIEAIRVIRDPGTSVGKGIAYILFKTRGATNLVIQKRSLKLRDRELRLSHARSNPTPYKRKNPSPSPWGRNDSTRTKRFAVDSTTPDNNNNKVKTKAHSSYQGVKGSKSGVQKKVNPKIIKSVKFKSGTQKGEKSNEWKNKRPAVTARKANALEGGGGGGSKQTGKKRKMGNQTPDYAHRNKKTKKFR